MNVHFLKINPDKTEILFLHPKSLKSAVIIRGTFIEGQCIRFSKEVKNVGVWLDENLNMNTHINKVVSHCYKSLKDIGRVRNVLTKKHTEMLVHSVITTMDYCNSLFYNVGKSNLFKLQKVQNAAARLIVRKRKRDSASAILRELHWLNIESRVMFKIILIVFKSIHGICSKNIKVEYKKVNCRPDDFLLLVTTNVKTKYGKRTFQYAGPRLWNALPPEVRKIEKVDVFKKHVKTILFADVEGFKRKAYLYGL